MVTRKVSKISVKTITLWEHDFAIIIGYISIVSQLFDDPQR